jgi:phage terminase large subunit-like protein
VEHVIKTAARDAAVSVRVKQVRASRGKHTRAEPIAALYEQRRAHHVGVFPELEDQQTTWIPGRKSPDRMDALVWALTELDTGAGPSPAGALDIGADSSTELGDYTV